MGKDQAKTAAKGCTAIGAGIVALGGVPFGAGMAIGEGVSLIAIAFFGDQSEEPDFAFDDLVMLPSSKPPTIPGGGRTTRVVNRLGEQGLAWITKARLLRGTAAKLQGAAIEQALVPALRLYEETMLLIEGVRVEQRLFALGLQDLRDATAGDPMAEMRVNRDEILEETRRMLLSGEVLEYERFVFDALRPTKCEVATMLTSLRTVLDGEIPETLTAPEALTMLAREIESLDVRSALPDLPNARDLATLCKTTSEPVDAPKRRRTKADVPAPPKD